MKLEHGQCSTHHTTHNTHTHLPPFPLSICIFILALHVGAHGSVRYGSVKFATLRYGSVWFNRCFHVFWKSSLKASIGSIAQFPNSGIEAVFVFNAQVSLMKFSCCPAARFGVASAASLFPYSSEKAKKTNQYFKVQYKLN